MLSKHIPFFLEAAQYLSFTEAAKHMYVTQQSMTWHIASLERELGVKLFIRSTRSVQLTAVGIYLRDQLTRINDEISIIVERARKMGIEHSNTATIGIYHAFSKNKIILPLLTALQSAFPDVYFNVKLMDLGELRNQLFDGKLDLGITTSYTWNLWNAVETQVIRSYPFKVFLSARHPILQSPFSFESLSELTLLTNEQPSSYSSEIQLRKNPVWRQQIPHRDYLFLPDMDTLMIYLETQRGFACLTENIECLSDNPRLVSFSIPFDDASSDLICAYPRNCTGTLPSLMSAVCTEAGKHL